MSTTKNFLAQPLSNALCRTSFDIKLVSDLELEAVEHKMKTKRVRTWERVTLNPTSCEKLQRDLPRTRSSSRRKSERPAGTCPHVKRSGSGGQGKEKEAECAAASEKTTPEPRCYLCLQKIKNWKGLHHVKSTVWAFKCISIFISYQKQPQSGIWICSRVSSVFL